MHKNLMIMNKTILRKSYTGVTDRLYDGFYSKDMYGRYYLEKFAIYNRDTAMAFIQISDKADLKHLTNYEIAWIYKLITEVVIQYNNIDQYILVDKLTELKLKVDKIFIYIEEIDLEWLNKLEADRIKLQNSIEFNEWLATRLTNKMTKPIPREFKEITKQPIMELLEQNRITRGWTVYPHQLQEQKGNLTEKKILTEKDKMEAIIKILNIKTNTKYDIAKKIIDNIDKLTELVRK